MAESVALFPRVALKKAQHFKIFLGIFGGEVIKLILSNISKIRQEKGYSLRQLEYKTGISKSTIFRLENNQTKLYLELLEKISIALNCKIEDLYIKI